MCQLVLVLPHSTQLHSCTQKPGETVATFVVELRQLSKFCEFGASLENMLRDWLVCGIASGIQQRLLAETKVTQQIPALQETLKRYAEVFENELGEIKWMEARIDVNLQAHPVFAKPDQSHLPSKTK